MNELKKQNHQWIAMRCPTYIGDLTHVYIYSHIVIIFLHAKTMLMKSLYSQFIILLKVDLLFRPFDDAIRTATRHTPSSSFSACARPLPSCSSLLGEGNARKSFAVTCMWINEWNLWFCWGYLNNAC